jgi:uncharacterized RDD family membrane protein YckC
MFGSSIAHAFTLSFVNCCAYWNIAILRYIGYIASSLFGWLGFVWALWDKDKQGWFDKLAGAYVVKVM